MKPKLLVISAVYPFPRQSGQQQRVFYKLKAFREHFHVTFLTISRKDCQEEVKNELEKYVDEAIVLKSRYTKNLLNRLWHRILGYFYTLLTGLKFSNYHIGVLEFPYSRIEGNVGIDSFDMILFEYWHAHRTARKMRKNKVFTVLDMHNILWQSYIQQLTSKKWMPEFVARSLWRRYKNREETSWLDFDVIIAINKAERDYVQEVLGDEAIVIYAPMGTDISTWPYCWEPSEKPRRIAYYGGLGSVHNQQDALLCYNEIMPIIWKQYPDIEFWIVGSNPPDIILELSEESRVHVTGYVEDVQEILKTMSLVLCPFSGTYGFRSRVVEVMALGVPVVASHDAVYGMGFEFDEGIVLGGSAEEMAELSMRWLKEEGNLITQSQLARKAIEKKFSYESTYLELADDLVKCLGRSDK